MKYIVYGQYGHCANKAHWFSNMVSALSYRTIWSRDEAFEDRKDRGESAREHLLEFKHHWCFGLWIDYVFLISGNLEQKSVRSRDQFVNGRFLTRGSP